MGQDVAGEQHAGQRVLEVVRDHVHQLLAFTGDAFEAVAGLLQADVRVDPRQQFFGHERFGDVVHRARRSEEHTSELQSLMRISYAVFCLKKKNLTSTSQNSSDSPTIN